MKKDLDGVAIDGNALRRSHDRSGSLGPLLHVRAWVVQRGISLGKLAYEEKSNGNNAIPGLIDQSDIVKLVVTIDATRWQKNIVGKIIDGKGRYVMLLNGN